MIAARNSWVMRLPRGLRAQPGWVFIGMLCSITGLSYLSGLAQSTNIARILNENFLRTWGGFLFVSGTLIVGATLAENRPLERLALRFLSLGFFVYTGWILTALPLTRATLTVALCVCLIVLSEIRVAVIKVILKPPPDTNLGEDT